MKRIVAIIVLLLLASCSDNSVENSINEEIEEKQIELGRLETDLANTEKTLESAKQELSEILTELAMNRPKLEKMEQIEDAERELQSLQRQIEESKNNLSSVQQESEQQQESNQQPTEPVSKEKSEFELGAGEYSVGEHLPLGRYEAFPVGSRPGHLIVRSSDGRRKVSDILGEEYLKSYTFVAEEGDTLELKIPVRFVPVD